MSDFYINRAYKRARPKTVKKVSNFEDHTNNFYSDKTVHFYNMGFHSTYSTVVTLQCIRAIIERFFDTRRILEEK
jgi:hypothetical protein